MDKNLRTPSETFRNVDHFSIAHGYGEMREGSYSITKTKESFNTPMDGSFIILPSGEFKGKATNSQHRWYMVFAYCESAELIRSIYNFGATGSFCFEKPTPNCIPEGWWYVIRESLPVCQAPGNLIFLIRRPKNDTRVVHAAKVPSMDMKTTSIWAVPQCTDLSSRRLVNCANLLRNPIGGHEQAAIDRLHRSILALDLTGLENPSKVFGEITEEVQRILDRLSQDQQGAFHHVNESKHPESLVQGPPDAGKFTLLVVMMEVS